MYSMSMYSMMYIYRIFLVLLDMFSTPTILSTTSNTTTDTSTSPGSGIHSVGTTGGVSDSAVNTTTANANTSTSALLLLLGGSCVLSDLLTIMNQFEYTVQCHFDVCLVLLYTYRCMFSIVVCINILCVYVYTMCVYHLYIPIYRWSLVLGIYHVYFICKYPVAVTLIVTLPIVATRRAPQPWTGLSTWSWKHCYKYAFEYCIHYCI